jgi:C4-dicarboxylate-specific signal transduction histidine kinase
MREGPLTQVFDNLISNACYWLGRKSDTNDRKLLVRIDAKMRQVLVTDNGPGVFPRFRDRIFEPFFSMKGDGRGLGLYIVKEILAERGGTIELLDPGEHGAMFPNGASFLVELPDKRATNA